MAHRKLRNRANALRLAGAVLAIAALTWTFHGTEPDRVGALLSRVGVLGVLVIVPQLLSLMLESAGWWLTFDAIGKRLPYLGLLRTRFATEALAQTLPLGVVFCESTKPLLLAHNCGADLSTSLAGMAARKWLQLSAQGLYVVVFALASWTALMQISPAVLHAAGLPWLLLSGGALLLLLALVSYAWLTGGRVSERFHAWLGLLPSRWLRARLARSRCKFSEADERLQRFFRFAVSSPLPLLACLLAWLCETAETLLILWLLGVSLPLATVGALEVSASFLRNVAVILPAGLGVQDLSYLAFLRALQVPDALNVAAAFLLLKRSKELVWAMFGYALLAVDLRVPPLAASPIRHLET